MRLIEWASYEEMIRRIGYAALVREWPRWRPRVRSEAQRRGLDFVVEWILKHHPELLTDEARSADFEADFQALEEIRQ